MKTAGETDIVLLRHMLECIDNIDADTQRRREVFFGSRMVRDAVLRNLQLLTESSQRLGTAVKATESGAPWRQLSGTRNILVHAYLGGIDEETVWATVARCAAADAGPVRRGAMKRAAVIGVG